MDHPKVSKFILGKSKKPDPVMFWAETYLNNMRKEWPKTKNLAVVMDIDDTALTGTPQKFNPHILEVYKLAKKLGYSLFFVTARPLFKDNYHYTVDQLKKNGFHDFQGLFLMDNYDQYAKYGTYSHYKSEARKKIYDAGYDIVLNIGDTWDDIMLQSPFVSDHGHTQKNKHLQSIPQNNYVILKPVDVSWMAIKMPYRN